MKKNNSRFISFFLVLVFLIGVIPVSAIGVIKETSDVPYDTFTYFENANVSASTAVRATGMFDFYNIYYNEDFDGVDFKSFTDVSVDIDDNVYVLDGVAGQINVLNKDYKYVRSITNVIIPSDNKYILDLVDEATAAKKDVSEYLASFGVISNADGTYALAYAGAEGMVVSAEGLVYICDTVHKRVIVTDNMGGFISVLLLPKSNLIPTDFDYQPQKIAVDSSNYIYVLSKGSYYGAILYSPAPAGEFLGFFGANTVASSAVDAFISFVKRLVVTDAQISQGLRALPYQFTDLYVDKQDFIYTATGRTKLAIENGQIKRLSPGGLNILDSESVSFGLRSFINKNGDKRYPNMAGLAIADNVVDGFTSNYIFTYDVSSGYISVYDDDCRMLNTFGGGSAGDGLQDGNFQSISSIDVNSAMDIIVLDNGTSKQCLTVFKINEYGALLLDADTLTRAGDYDTAMPLWEQVLTMDRNSQIAYSGIAKTYYANGNYKLAMEYAKTGYDYQTYSLSYEFVRRDFIERNVYWIFAIIVLVVVAIVLFMAYKRKKGLVLIKNRELVLFSRVMLHPSEVFTEMKEKKRGSTLIGFILIVLYYITTSVKETASGFLFRAPSTTGFNSFLVLLQTFGIVLLWTICNWAVCTLAEGKGKMKEIFVVTSYSILPLIISNIVYTVASNFILVSEAAFLSIFVTVMQLFTALILIIGTMIVHDYSFGKFVGTTILSILGILIVIFLGVVVVILVQQLFMFFGTVYRELVYR